MARRHEKLKAIKNTRLFKRENVDVDKSFAEVFPPYRKGKALPHRR